MLSLRDKKVQPLVGIRILHINPPFITGLGIWEALA